jgi:small Trp-rich protein
LRHSTAILLFDPVAVPPHNVIWNNPVDSKTEALQTWGCNRHQGTTMPLIIITFLLVILKAFEVWRFAEMSWGWVILAFVITFIWFEYLERLLGLDKNRAHDMYDKIRKDRVKKEFEQQNKRK